MTGQIRYFYDDPLAAAWMAKHHGIRFVNTNNGANIGIDDILHHAQTGNYCHINIHPDSLPLLEPKDHNDLLKIIGGHYHGSAVTGPRVPKPMQAAWTGDPAIMPREYQGFEIILRNGIPFHHPQSEQAP